MLSRAFFVLQSLNRASTCYDLRKYFNEQRLVVLQSLNRASTCYDTSFAYFLDEIICCNPSIGLLPVMTGKLFKRSPSLSGVAIPQSGFYLL